MEGKNKYTEIENFLKELDDSIGNILYVKIGDQIKVQKNTYSWLFFPKNIKKNLIRIKNFSNSIRPLTFIATVMLFLISTLIITKFDLLSVIIGFATICMVIVMYSFIKLAQNKISDVRNMIKWCSDLYNIDVKFHPLVRNIAKKQLNDIKIMDKPWAKFLKAIYVIMYVNCLACTFGFAIIGTLFLPETLYPKYSPPVPLFLPFSNQETWTAFTITLMGQTKASLDVAAFGTFIITLLAIISVHFFTYLSIIKETICELNSNLEQLERQNLRNGTTATFDFDKWIKIITDMTCEVSILITKFNSLFTGFFLLLEMASFASLFIFGLTILIIKQQYIYGISVTWIALNLYLICFINERILDEFSDITFELYNIPWYNLTIKQQKLFLISLNTDFIQNGFCALNFHDLTIERFGDVMQAAYRICISLRDLINK